jgi:hypothetical protein
VEIKNEKPCKPTLLKKEELNKLITFCYNTAISYSKSKFNHSENLPNITQHLEKLAIRISASIFYFDELKCLRLSPEHEKAMNELNEVDFKFHLFESIRSKLDEAITNNSLYK